MTRRKEWDRREQLLGVGKCSDQLRSIATLSEVRGIAAFSEPFCRRACFKASSILPHE